MTKVIAPCRGCCTRTYHNTLYIEEREFDETFALIECAGCGRISMAHTYLVSGGTCEERREEHWVDYYPSPASRSQPWWLAEIRLSGPEVDMDYHLQSLFAEIYEALWGGQHRLAAMGIRALLEQVMVNKIGDHGSFGKNLDVFCERGFIARLQRNALRAVLDVGHAAMHRMYHPTETDLNTSLDITESIFASIYVHANAARDLGNRVPARRQTEKIIPWKEHLHRRSPTANDDGARE